MQKRDPNTPDNSWSLEPDHDWISRRYLRGHAIPWIVGLIATLAFFGVFVYRVMTRSL